MNPEPTSARQTDGARREPTPAASVLLARGPHFPQTEQEVLAVQRSAGLRFFGGFLAFPGGKVDPLDEGLGVDPRRAAAVRELFEETGVLLARGRDGRPAAGRWDEARRDILADRLPFASLLANLDLHLDASDLVLAGSLVTPPFSPMRFDTSFFVAQLPPGQTAEVWPGELAGCEWATPTTLLDAWTRGDRLLTPPTLTILETIRGRSAFDLPDRLAPLLARLDAGALPPICFAPGVHMLPLKTVGLPPITHTNAFLVGTDVRWLIDPGAHEQDEQERMFSAVDEVVRGQESEVSGQRSEVKEDNRTSSRGPIAGIVLTHHHPDHIGGVQAAVERYRVPVLAHRRTAELLGGRIKIDRMLDEGDRLELGQAADGSGPWFLEALLTPGHAAGHLAFFEPHYRLLLAGDVVSTLTSIVIAPPDGDLAEYLATLRRVRELDLRMLLPAHGGPSLRPRQLLEDAIEHRHKREQQLLAALAEGPASASDLASRLYNGLAGPLQTLARWQVLAGLEKLRREGRALRQESGVRSQESGVGSQESGVRGQESGPEPDADALMHWVLTPDS